MRSSFFLSYSFQECWYCFQGRKRRNKSSLSILHHHCSIEFLGARTHVSIWKSVSRHRNTLLNLPTSFHSPWQQFWEWGSLPHKWVVWHPASLRYHSARHLARRFPVTPGSFRTRQASSRHRLAVSPGVSSLRVSNPFSSFWLSLGLFFGH